MKIGSKLPNSTFFFKKNARTKLGSPKVVASSGLHTYILRNAVLRTYYLMSREKLVRYVNYELLRVYAIKGTIDLSPNSRALSLRNLVSRYECGRVVPAGVGPGSPSRDTANWMPSRFSLSVETRRRYGWLRMVFPGALLFRTPIWCPSGGIAARERQETLSRRAW